MKPQYKLFILVIIFSFSQLSLAQDPNTMLHGTWELDYQATLSAALIDTQNKINNMPAAPKAHMEAVYIDREMHFDAFGNCLLTLQGGQSKTFTWTYNAQTDVVTLTDTANKVQTFEILNLTSGALSFEIKTAPSDVSAFVFSELYFNKI
nr:hypothetical protein [Gaetbulibacter sp. 4G1]